MSGIVTRIVVLIAIMGTAGGCANTIRGVGQDTANMVDATQQAGRAIGNSAASGSY
ncbi:entericidin [Chelativorans intermedius]|uniref:Entericidin n=1 Tax=Chelativorans intermedius TaxID=515947 RepID=A0ABV6D3V0_9HYPH|nr:entericidin [Chelativorans intermedius]MCT8997027.1 entericidin [Chelativorans intermedius]